MASNAAQASNSGRPEAGPGGRGGAGGRGRARQLQPSGALPQTIQLQFWAEDTGGTTGQPTVLDSCEECVWTGHMGSIDSEAGLAESLPFHKTSKEHALSENKQRAFFDPPFLAAVLFVTVKYQT